jgi:hypothetical protein
LQPRTDIAQLGAPKASGPVSDPRIGHAAERAADFSETAPFTYMHIWARSVNG